MLCFILFVHFYACLEFPSTDTVFVKVVSVHLYNIQRRIGIVVPAAAEVDHVVHASYLVLTREVQSQRIVFAIAGIGHFHFAQHRSVEGARGTQTVDAEGIVASVCRALHHLSWLGFQVYVAVPNFYVGAGEPN